MSYLQHLHGRGCSFVGPSADWVDAAVRTSGNQWAGEVVMETSGMLSRLAYTFHDGDLADEVAEVEVVPDLTPAVFAAYCTAADAFTPGNVDPVACLERACAVLGLRCWGDPEAEHLTLVCDIAGALDTWHRAGWRLSEVDATDLASLGRVSLMADNRGLVALDDRGRACGFLSPAGLWLDSDGRNLLP